MARSVPNPPTGRVTVYDATAVGNVAPKRFYGGDAPHTVRISNDLVMLTGAGRIWMLDRTTTQPLGNFVPDDNRPPQVCVPSGTEMFCSHSNSKNPVNIYPITVGSPDRLSFIAMIFPRAYGSIAVR